MLGHSFRSPEAETIRYLCYALADLKAVTKGNPLDIIVPGRQLMNRSVPDRTIRKDLPAALAALFTS